MKYNEILDEIHRIREEHARECGYDIHKMFEQLRENTERLQAEGIQVTRRTVAKYREDMRIPSTHQRRVRK